jgi:hypothetical protein
MSKIILILRNQVSIFSTGYGRLSFVWQWLHRTYTAGTAGGLIGDYHVDVKGGACYLLYLDG